MSAEAVTGRRVYRQDWRGDGLRERPPAGIVAGEPWARRGWVALRGARPNVVGDPVRVADMSAKRRDAIVESATRQRARRRTGPVAREPGFVGHDLLLDEGAEVAYAPGSEPGGGVGIEPDPSRMVAVPVRAMSATWVRNGHFVDHSDPEHLRAAVPLFDRLPIFENHLRSPSRNFGFTADPFWDEAPAAPDNVPGVTVTAVIDGGRSAAAFAVARGVLERSLRRWSVGILLTAIPTHPELDVCAFYDAIGHELDGRVVGWVAQSIDDADELSIVDHGADETALSLPTEMRPRRRRRAFPRFEAAEARA